MKTPVTSAVEKHAEKYTPHYVVHAEGHPIGLTSCRRCGALVLLGDEEFDGPAVHDAWHFAGAGR